MYSNTEIVTAPVVTLQVASNLSISILKILHNGHLKFTPVSLADPRGAREAHIPQVQNSVIFMQFSAKKIAK